MGFSLLFDIIYVTLQSYYYQIIIVDMKKTLLTLAIMAATTTTAREVTITTTVREATTTIVRVQVSTARADSVSLHVQNRLSTMCLKWIRTRKYA